MSAPSSVRLTKKAEKARNFQYKTDSLLLLLEEKEDFDPIDNQFHAELFKYAYPAALAYNEIMTRHNGSPLGVEFQSKEGNRYAFITRDMSQHGAYRIQYFDRDGFSGHAVYKSLGETVQEMVKEGYRSEVKGALSQLSSTVSFMRGNEVSALIGKLNAGQITHQEFVDMRDQIYADI